MTEKTDVLIIGGGPAGSLLACMLARRGIDVLLVEKQATLERSFRGETLVGTAVVALRELGFGPALEEHGYLETQGMRMTLEGQPALTLEYRKTSAHAAHVDMPQPALLRILNRAASSEPSFRYLAGTTMTDLVVEGGQVVGAVLRGKDGNRTTVRSRLLVGADGRFSKVRKESGLEAKITPMNRDVLWFKVPRPAGWGDWAEFSVDGNKHLVTLPTFPNDLRVAQNLPKRGLGELRRAGFDDFKATVAGLDPRLGPLMDQHMTSFDDTSFLEIFTAEVRKWARDGLVLIGDASHTCTPILGQGVNLSIQDCALITPVIANALRKSRGSGPLPASVFDEYAAGRQPYKKRVTRFQTAQEESLSVSGRREIAIRKIRYRTLNALPIKHWIIGRVLGMAPIHPIDRRAETLVHTK